MNDNDIIKALECCCKNNNCEGCPLDYLTFSSQCASELAIKSLDLIYRQKAEIERLNKDIDIIQSANVELYSALDNARVEAITEFAERLKKYYNKLDKSQGVLISFHIDQIANELKEGVNNA